MLGVRVSKESDWNIQRVLKKSHKGKTQNRGFSLCFTFCECCCCVFEQALKASTASSSYFLQVENAALHLFSWALIDAENSLASQPLTAWAVVLKLDEVKHSHASVTLDSFFRQAFPWYKYLLLYVTHLYFFFGSDRSSRKANVCSFVRSSVRSSELSLSRAHNLHLFASDSSW